MAEDVVKLSEFISDNIGPDTDTYIIAIKDNGGGSYSNIAIAWNKIIDKLEGTGTDGFLLQSEYLVDGDATTIKDLIKNINNLDNYTTTTALNTLLNGKQKSITSGTSDPSGGNDGDIYLKYEA